MDKKGVVRLARAKLQEKDGASLLIALVITLCMVMLALSVLLASYSLFTSVNKRETVRQCHELALSLSEVMGQEITADIYGTENIESASQFMLAMNDPAGIQNKYPLWFFLRTNILQGEVWRWYDEDDLMHLDNVAWRTYQVEGTGLDYKLEATLYWISDKEEAEPDFDPEADLVKFGNAAPEVVVMVTCSKGKVKSTVTSRYELTVDAFEEEDDLPDRTFSMGGKTIYVYEKWSFNLLNRR